MCFDNTMIVGDEKEFTKQCLMNDFKMICYNLDNERKTFIKF